MNTCTCIILVYVSDTLYKMPNKSNAQEIMEGQGLGRAAASSPSGRGCASQSPAGDPPYHCRPASLSYHYNGVQSFRTLCGCRPIAAACCKGVRIRAGPVQVRQAALIILTMAVKHQEGASMVVIIATVRLGPSRTSPHQGRAG